jgi:hypothetical protein
VFLFSTKKKKMEATDSIEFGDACHIGRTPGMPMVLAAPFPDDTPTKRVEFRWENECHHTNANRCEDRITMMMMMMLIHRESLMRVFESTVRWIRATGIGTWKPLARRSPIDDHHQSPLIVTAGCGACLVFNFFQYRGFVSEENHISSLVELFDWIPSTYYGVVLIREACNRKMYKRGHKLFSDHIFVCVVMEHFGNATAKK